MSHREPAFSQQQLNIAREAQEADDVGNGCSILASAVGDFLMAEMHFTSQPLKSLSGLHWIEVLTLDVFDESDFEHALVGIVLNDGWNIGQSRELGRPESPFPRNQLTRIAFASHDQ